MKSIIFIIFIIISICAISSKNLRARDIIKGSRNHPPSSNSYTIKFVSFGPPVMKSPRATIKIPKKDNNVI